MALSSLVFGSAALRTAQVPSIGFASTNDDANAASSQYFFYYLQRLRIDIARFFSISGFLQAVVGTLPVYQNSR